MKLQAGHLLGVYDALESLSEKKRSVMLPVRVAFRLGQLKMKIAPDMLVLRDVRNRLINEFGVVGEDKIVRVEDPEAIKLFMEQWSPLSNDLIDVAFEPILLSLFGDTPVTLNEIMVLGPFIKDDTDA